MFITRNVEKVLEVSEISGGCLNKKNPSISPQHTFFFCTDDESVRNSFQLQDLNVGYFPCVGSCTSVQCQLSATV